MSHSQEFRVVSTDFQPGTGHNEVRLRNEGEDGQAPSSIILRSVGEQEKFFEKNATYKATFTKVTGVPEEPMVTATLPASDATHLPPSAEIQKGKARK